MERLTKHLPGGAADYNYPANCYFDNDSVPNIIAQSAFRQRCVERLADYEDTWLTPEEVERSKLEIEAGCVKAIARTYGIDINRLRKLAEADKDGRLVVRCKDCKHLCVLNRKDIYAFCTKTNTVFLPFELDTRTHFCSLGKRKDEANES